jgi:TPP-dependent pyruvate/acetoin dehydrogenase alpha subunit
MALSADNISLYRSLYRIRRFEETVLEEFPHGRFYGTTHTYLGQEADAVGVLDHLQPEDVVVSNHRCHGHFLAYGGDMRALFAELMGKATGVCGGRGGSQHLHWRNFYSNGILGGTIPLASGMALAEKKRGSEAIVVAFLGDGTLGEGVVYESLNMAALWCVPIVYVLENNAIAQTTPLELHFKGDLPGRFKAFGIPSFRLESSDVLEIRSKAFEILKEVRAKGTPQALILDTCRFGPHSKGDDTRSIEILARLRQERDPIQIHGARLSLEKRQRVEAKIDTEVRNAFELALDDPLPQPAIVRESAE